VMHGMLLAWRKANINLHDKTLAEKLNDYNVITKLNGHIVKGLKLELQHE